MRFVSSEGRVRIRPVLLLVPALMLIGFFHQRLELSRRAWTFDPYPIPAVAAWPGQPARVDPRLAVALGGDTKVVLANDELIIQGDAEDVVTALYWGNEGRSMIEVRDRGAMVSLTALDTSDGSRTRMDLPFASPSPPNAPPAIWRHKVFVVDDFVAVLRSPDRDSSQIGPQLVLWRPLGHDHVVVELDQLARSNGAIDLGPAYATDSPQVVAAVERFDGLESFVLNDEQLSINRFSLPGINYQSGRTVIVDEVDLHQGQALVRTQQLYPRALIYDELLDESVPTSACQSIHQAYVVDLVTGAARLLGRQSQRDGGADEEQITNRWVFSEGWFDPAGRPTLRAWPRSSNVCTVYSDFFWGSTLDESQLLQAMDDGHGGFAELGPEVDYRFGNDGVFRVEHTGRGNKYAVEQDGRLRYDGAAFAPLDRLQVAVWPKPTANDELGFPQATSGELFEADLSACETADLTDAIDARPLDESGLVQLGPDFPSTLDELGTENRLYGVYLEPAGAGFESQCYAIEIFNLFEGKVGGEDWSWCVTTGGDLLAFGPYTYRHRIHPTYVELLSIGPSTDAERLQEECRSE